MRDALPEPVYMTAEELDLLPEVYAGLLEIAEDLESGRIKHWTGKSEKTGKRLIRLPDGEWFNMANWAFGGRGLNMSAHVATQDCGTVCCIGGWLEVRSAERLPEARAKEVYSSLRDHENLEALFHPEAHDLKGPVAWHTIKPQQAADVIRRYLMTGDVDWHLFLNDSQYETD